MAVLNGNDVLLYVGSQAIGCLTNATFSSSREEVEVTCKDNDGARQVIGGSLSATITFEGFYNPASTYTVDDLFTLHQADTEFNWHMGDNENFTLHGMGRFTQLEYSAPVNAGTTFSGTIAVTGAYTFSTT
jgi:predicted secreted protein